MTTHNTPNFFVVGAAKSGTTTLHNYLAEHPDVFMPEMKELHFFSHQEVAKTYYKPAKIVTSFDEYHQQFEEAAGYKAIGEATPNYLYYPQTPTRIKEYNPQSKIIMILRNPVDRAISHYLMDVNLGFHDRPITDFYTRTADNELYYDEYISTGLYADQIKRYTDLFGKDRVLILDYASLRADPVALAQTIYRFLGIDDSFSPDVDQVHNSFGVPRFGFYKMKRNSSILTKVVSIIPAGIKGTIKGLLTNKNAPKPTFETEKEHIYKLFHKDLQQLSEEISWTKKWIQ